MALKTILTTAALALCLSIPGMAQEQAARDSAERAQRQLDSLRVHSISLGTNLFYWGSSTPNAHFWIPLGENFTVGMVGGIKAWPRWWPWDNDPKIDRKWRHFALVPGVRFWRNRRVLIAVRVTTTISAPYVRLRFNKTE